MLFLGGMPGLSQSFMSKAGALPELDRHKLSLSQADLDSHKSFTGLSQADLDSHKSFTGLTDVERYNQALLHQNTMKDAQSMLHRNGHLIIDRQNY